MSRRWTPPLVACAIAALVWGCAARNISVGPTRTDAAGTVRLPAPATAAPAGTRLTTTGVYTEEQASKGRDVYSGQCLSCHAGEHNTGQFRHRWAGKPLSNLYGLMVETMPQDNPGSLEREQYVQVIAYLLKLNGLPAGTEPLPVDSLALTKIRLDTLAAKQ